jgi:hypothetical protein
VWRNAGLIMAAFRMLPNLNVVLHERHYREPFKNSVPGGRLLRRAKPRPFALA